MTPTSTPTWYLPANSGPGFHQAHLINQDGQALCDAWLNETSTTHWKPASPNYPRRCRACTIVAIANQQQQAAT